MRFQHQYSTINTQMYDSVQYGVLAINSITLTIRRLVDQFYVELHLTTVNAFVVWCDVDSHCMCGWKRH